MYKTQLEIESQQQMTCVCVGYNLRTASGTEQDLIEVDRSTNIGKLKTLVFEKHKNNLDGTTASSFSVWKSKTDFDDGKDCLSLFTSVEEETEYYITLNKQEQQRVQYPTLVFDDKYERITTTIYPNFTI